MPKVKDNENGCRIAVYGIRFMRKAEHFNVDDCVIKVYNIYVCLIENSERKD